MMRLSNPLTYRGKRDHRLSNAGRLRALRSKSIKAFALLTVLSSCSSEKSAPEELDKLIAEMSQRVEATTVKEKRGDLIPRFNQPKTVACLTGTFTVEENISTDLKHGLFAQAGTYPVTARFANATKWDDSEKDLRGLSLSVSNIPSETLWGKTGQQDFLLNSHPALFVATPEEFLKFMRARQEGDKLSLVKFFLSPFDPHIGSLITVLKARGKHKSPLDIRYWSTVPSALDDRITGAEQIPADVRAVKYSVRSCSNYKTEQVVEPGENQLRKAITAHLDQAPACLDFSVQLQTNSEDMPLEDASVVWDEAASPFISVAKINFDDQPVEDPELINNCENLSFNPWQSLPAHAPLGRMNAVRKAVYAKGAYQRANR